MATSYLRYQVYNAMTQQLVYEGPAPRTHTDGRAHLWTLDANDNAVSVKAYGPNPGWAATSYARWRIEDLLAGIPPTYEGRLLWTHTDGRAHLWGTLDANDNAVSVKAYGPYPDWGSDQL